jgi:peroxiredoxin
VVGIDWSDARGEAVHFIARYRWTFPVLRDAEGTVGDAYGLTNLPTTVVVDPNGTIAAELRGPQSVASLTRALAGA